MEKSSFETELDGFKRLMEERDRRYSERDRANNEAFKTAMTLIEKINEKSEQSLKEYKSTSNEWRDTVKDLVSNMPTRRDLGVLEDKIADLRESRSASAGSQHGIGISAGVVYAIIATIIGLAGIAIGIIRQHG